MEEKDTEHGSLALEYAFDLLEVGCTGTIEIIPESFNKSSKKELKPLTTLPCGLPPLFAPDLKTDLEKYLLDPTVLPIHDFQRTQRFWPRERDPESLLFSDVCPVPSTLKVERNPTTGELLGYNEVMLTDTGCTSKNSMSLLRQPGPLSASVKGESTNYPFLPGGMETLETTKPGLVFDGELNFEKDLLSVPPGFKKGARFTEDKEDQERDSMAPVPQIVAMSDIMAGTTLEDLEYSDDGDDLETDEEDIDKLSDKSESVSDPEDGTEGSLQRQDSLEKVLVEGSDSEKTRTSSSLVTDKPIKEEWAVMVNVTEPVKGFHKRVPDMAHEVHYRFVQNTINAYLG